MGAGSLGAGFLAGILSTLSPCVLPLLPLVLGAALSAHRWGALVLAAGLAVSFTAIGLFVATVGFAVGLDGEMFRAVSAVLLAVAGIVLLSTPLQQRVALAGSSIANAGNDFLQRLSPSGLAGQLTVGLVLGAIWAPCVGPTLGAASVLAAQGRDLGAVAAVMLAFGLGAALPLVLVSALSREAMLRWRGRLIQVGTRGKLVLGAGALVLAALILTGADRRVEATLVEASPAWLTDLTTRF